MPRFYRGFTPSSFDLDRKPDALYRKSLHARHLREASHLELNEMGFEA